MRGKKLGYVLLFLVKKVNNILFDDIYIYVDYLKLCLYEFVMVIGYVIRVCLFL